MRELPTSGAVGSVRAQELLADVTALRRRVRRPTGLWPPLVVNGAVAIVGAPLGPLGSLAVSLWWLAAAPVAFTLIGRHVRQHARRQGIEGSSRLLRALGMGSFAACWLACLILVGAAHLPLALTWVIALALGYLAWSCYARSAGAAAVAVTLAATGTGLALSPVPEWTVQLGVGIIMVAGGLVLRHGPEAT